MNLTEEIREYAKQIEPELIRIRRELHRHAEVSMKEVKTSLIIAEELRKIPFLEVQTGLAGGTGVMATLRGKREGSCVLLRADIDALPIQEELDLPYKSQNDGVMHACGHDAHAAWILGSAMILSKFSEQLSGTVKFLFQPGEEQGKGAREMVKEDRVLENPTVDYAFAAHGWPSIDSGKIGIARRYAFGCPGGFHAVIKGKGGHGSWPYQAINPIVVAAQICTALPQILADRIQSIEPRVISIGSIHAGEPGIGNIISDTCEFSGTIRATKPEVMEKIKEEIEKVIQGCCLMHGAEYEYECHYGNSVENASELISCVDQSAGEILGKENVFVIEQDHLGGENFSEFSSRVPSVYMFVGIRNLKITEEFSLHSPKYQLDESVLAPAAAVFSKIVFDLI